MSYNQINCIEEGVIKYQWDKGHSDTTAITAPPFIASNVKSRGGCASLISVLLLDARLGWIQQSSFFNSRGLLKVLWLQFLSDYLCLKIPWAQPHQTQASARGFGVTEQGSWSLRVFSHKSSRHKDFAQPFPHWFTSCRLWMTWVQAVFITGQELQFYILANRCFFLSFELQPTLCLAQSSTNTQYIVCFLLFVAPPIQAEVIILQLCTRAPVSECSPQVMDSVSGMSDPLRWLFPLMHYGGSFLFLCGLIWARRRDLPRASVFTSSVWV